MVLVGDTPTSGMPTPIAVVSVGPVAFSDLLLLGVERGEYRAAR